METCGCASSSMIKLNDPAKAKAYFESKMAFTIGPVELDRALKKESNVVVVDVRAPEDFAKGHIPGAISLPEEKWTRFEGLQRDKINVVYCYSQNCHLAARAALEFASHGYSVMELDGGFADWKLHEFDIVKEPVNRLKRHFLLHRHD